MDGRHPHGTTVSAFASLCPAPPMVLVSLDNRSHLLAIIRRTDRSSARSSSATDTDASTAGLQPVAAPPRYLLRGSAMGPPAFRSGMTSPPCCG
ncbi:flavin reductase [Streptomyces sp. NPDC005388]|uniref:flavin reductase n=1 Tax=Streptomyces sp. NPDC005388 TaxID=3156717 RepID=UPI0033B6ABCF